jgi:hypothetical protein
MSTKDEAFLIEEWGYSEHLAKACIDYFDYAIGLVDGTIWRVHEMDAISRDWVRIKPESFMNNADRCGDAPTPFPFARGVDVRVSCIMWVADAPHGS